MQNFTVFSAHTASAYFWLAFLTLFSIACICAFASIFHKSGFSPWWALVPAAPTLLILGLLYMVFFIPRTISTGLGTISLPSTTGDWPDLIRAIDVLDLVNVIAFFVFAIVPWPVEREIAQLRISVREARSAAFFANVRTPASAPPPSSAMTRVPPAGGGRPGFGPGTALLVAPALAIATEVTSFFCSWCGKERRSDALSIHHCGSRERIPAFCASCGRVLEDGVRFCDGCGADASRLSPP